MQWLEPHIENLYLSTLLRSIDPTRESWRHHQLPNDPLSQTIRDALLDGKGHGRHSGVLSPFAMKTGSAKTGYRLAGIRHIPQRDDNQREFAKNPKAGTSFDELLSDFNRELDALDASQSAFILPLVYRYFSATGTDRAGVSLYDLARLTAGIRVAQAYHGAEEQTAAPAPFLLIKGDVSGIQQFIFDVQSKGAAKSMKSRSFRIQAIALLAIRGISQALGLSPANLLYEGGGNFYLLGPNTASARLALQSLQRRSAEEHLADEERSRDPMYLHLGATPISLAQLCRGDGDAFGEVARLVNEDKKQRYAELFHQPAKPGEMQAEEAWQKLFEPQRAKNQTERRDREKKAFSTMTEQLRRANALEFLEIDPQNKEPFTRWFSIWNQELRARPFQTGDLSLTGPSAGCRDWGHAVLQLPEWKKDGNKRIHRAVIQKELERSQNDPEREFKSEKDFNGLVEFNFLAQFAGERTGTAKLGVMKADIDDLGRMFQDEMAEDYRSVAHYAALSRSLKWFFEGYVNCLLDRKIDEDFPFRNPELRKFYATGESYRDNIYVLFSGGDDFFVVGGWDVVVQFGMLLRKEFRKFTGNNLSFSAGIAMVDPKFPVVRFSELADDAERQAKRNPHHPKDSLSLFDAVMSWHEVGEMVKLSQILVDLRVEARQPVAVIRKVAKAVQSYETLLSEVKSGQPVQAPRLWRLNQALRETVARHEKLAELLISLVETRIVEVMHNPTQALNPWYIAAGTRWVEFLTKKTL